MAARLLGKGGAGRRGVSGLAARIEAALGTGAIQLFGPDVSESDRAVWSHPAVVANRLYIRNRLAVYCFLLE